MLTLYGLKNCQTCQKACKWLDRHAIAYRFSDYREDPIPSAMLSAWASQAGDFKHVINAASTTWRQLPAPRRSPATQAEWVVLLRDYPALIRRPVLVGSDGQYLAQGFSHGVYEKLISSGTHDD